MYAIFLGGLGGLGSRGVNCSVRVHCSTPRGGPLLSLPVKSDQTDEAAPGQPGGRGSDGQS